MSWYLIAFQFYADGKNARNCAENLEKHLHDQSISAIYRVYDDIRARVADWTIRNMNNQPKLSGRVAIDESVFGSHWFFSDEDLIYTN
jgi:hypothetical protein